MIGKVWKKVLLLVLIIACLYNIVAKLVTKSSYKEELRSSAQYIQDRQDTNGENE